MSSRYHMGPETFGAVANLQGLVLGAGFVTWPSMPAAAEVAQAQIAQALRMGGAHLDLQNSDGDTLLHVASRDGALSTVSALIGAGARLDLLNGQGRTALDELHDGHLS